MLAAALLLPAASPASDLRIEAEEGAAAILEAARQAYARAKPKSAVPAIEINGAGGAVAKLCNGQLAAAGTGRALADAEKALCVKREIALVELPLGKDAVAFVVNPRNTWAKQINVAELQKAWLEGAGEAATWKSLNSSWPSRPLKLYGPTPRVSVATNYRAALLGDAKGARALRPDISSSDVMESVIEGVARDPDGMGVLDWATFSANSARVRILPVEHEGKAIQPTQQSVSGGSYGRFAYPVLLHVNVKSLQDPYAREFLDYVLANGERWATQTGLVASPSSEYQRAREHLRGIP